MAMDYEEARALLIEYAQIISAEEISLENATGRILAKDLIAQENIPAFDRSPYDGYAFRSEDTLNGPVTLSVLEEIPAGSVPTKTVTAGTASKVLTGAPIPEGADAVEMFEKTEFTEHTVTILQPSKPGNNVVVAGEDVKAGTILAKAGCVIDAGIAGMLASQGIVRPLVYKIPKIGLISTGSELVDASEVPGPGLIRDTNRYSIGSAVKSIGLNAAWLGHADDTVEAIASMMVEGLKTCDCLILTGGVSVGDYDLTPAAMEAIGAKVLVRGVALKPGMACAYAIKDGKLLIGLSGNPASSLTNLYAVVVPALKKMTGRCDYLPDYFDVRLLSPFKKKSPATRFLRGKITLADGSVRMILPKDQGNVVLSSAIGCNAMALVPAGSGPVDTDTVLKGFLL